MNWHHCVSKWWNCCKNQFPNTPEPVQARPLALYREDWNKHVVYKKRTTCILTTGWNDASFHENMKTLQGTKKIIVLVLIGLFMKLFGFFQLLLLFYYFKISCLKTAIQNFSLNFCFAYGFTKTISTMGISM